MIKGEHMSIKRWLIPATASLSIVAICSGGVSASAKTVNDENAAAVAEAEWSQVETFISENPGDYAGLEQLTQELWGEGLSVAVSGIDGTVSGAEAQVVLDAFDAAGKQAVRDAGGLEELARSQPVVTPLSVPPDAFSVAFAFIPVPAQGIFYPRAAYGTWDFRDDYVNGSDPDDIAAIRMQTDNPNCTDIISTNASNYFSDGTAGGGGYLKDAGLGTDSPIYGFNDYATNFQLSVDHGSMLTHLNYGCGPSTVRGMFTYEHNQDGGAVLSVGASFLGFGVTYAGVGSTLQKSSGIASFSF